MMKYAYVLMLFLVVCSAGMAATKTVNFRTADEDPYFCNPCRITYTNSTHSLSARSDLGASNITFDGTASSYTIAAYAQMIAFNESVIVTMGSSDSSANADFYMIKSRGAVALITDGVSRRMYPFFQNNDGISYSYERMKNLTKAFGFSGLNSFNAGANYTLSGSYSVNAFNSYDTVLIGGVGTASPSVAAAVDNARQAGVNIIIPSETLYSSSFAFSSLVTRDTSQFGGNWNWMYVGGRNTGAIYPQGNQYLNDPSPYDYDMYPDSREGVGGVSGYYTRAPELFYSEFGDETFISYRFAGSTTSGAHPKVDKPLFSHYSGMYIVFSMKSRDSYGVYEHHSPTIKALMYLALTDFNTTEPFSSELTINVYEGTEECGNVEPIPNVLCCIGTGCGMSSAVTSTDVPYTSKVAPLENPEYTARGDATDKVLFWSSYSDFSQPVTYYGVLMENWERELASISQGEKKWLTYRDIAQRRSRVVFAGGRGTTDGEDNYLVYYDFYDTYMDVSKIKDINFYIKPLDSSNSGALDFAKYVLGILTYGFKSCETGDNWNMSMYYGINTSHWKEHGVNCINGNPNWVSSTLTSIPDFNMSDITWHYGYAPDFIDFANEIGGDVFPMKTAQSKKYNLNFDWVIHMVVFRFEAPYVGGTGATTDTGGFMELEDSTLGFTWTKYEGGNITLFGYGEETVTCVAPSGYAFYNPITEEFASEYVRNISLYSDTSLGIMLQRQRPLKMRIQVSSNTHEYVDNARCSIQGFSDTYSTNGYCTFNNVQPNAEYSVEIRTTGANPKSVNFSFFTGDYYDSFDADENGMFCGNFDGNFTFNANIDQSQRIFYPYILTSGENVAVANAIVDVDGVSCRTGTSGTCRMLLPIKHGSPYELNVRKHPQIIPKTELIYGSQMDCNAENLCSYFVYVQKNSTYAGHVNDDTTFVDYIGFDGDLDVFQAITVVMNMMSKPIFLGLLIIACVTVVLGYWLGTIGVIVGITTGVLLTLSAGLIPSGFAIGYFITLALVVAVLMRSGLLSAGGAMHGGEGS